MSRPDDYRSPPPPGQGYHNQYPAESGYDNRFESGPRPPRDPGYVPYQDTYNNSGPPPRDAYPPRDTSFSPSQESFASGGLPPPPRSQYGRRDRDNEARSSPRPGSMNQMAPYDDNKAYAQEQDYWQEQQRGAYTHGRPPPSSAGYGRRSEDSYDDRDYYDRDRRARRSRRYSDDDSVEERAMRYPSDPKKGGRDVLGASEGEGERGLAANLAGLAAGGFLGNRLGKGGAIGTISGAVVGAIAAQAAERQYAKRKEDKVLVKRSAEDPYAVPAGPYPQRGRDMDDVRASQRDVDPEKPTGFRARLRSLSRSARGRSRRSPSVESVERDHYR